MKMASYFKTSDILDRRTIVVLKILNKTAPRPIKKFKDFGLKAQKKSKISHGH